MTTATMTSELSDAEYDVADQIEALLEADPTRSWTPSRVARRVHVTTPEATRVLAYMVANRYITAAGNGAWTRYAARI